MRAAMGRWRHYGGEVQRVAAADEQQPEQLLTATSTRIASTKRGYTASLD